MCHSKSCLDRLNAYRNEVKRFEDKYPNYCLTCGGHGGYWYRDDPSDSGVSLAPGFTVDFEYCEDCIYKGACPLCGGDVTDNDLMVCRDCGWTENDRLIGLPDPSLLECDCCADCRKAECDFPPEVYRQFSDLYEVLP